MASQKYHRSVKISPNLHGYMEKFQSAGVAIDSLSSIKGFCTKFNPKNDLQAIYFKR